MGVLPFVFGSSNILVYVFVQNLLRITNRFVNILNQQVILAYPLN